MRVLIALGGNALLRRGERPDADVQLHNITVAAQAIADVARDHDVVITHGNGPQIGLLALESASDPSLRQPYPLDVLGAQTQGMIGYLIDQAIRNALPDRQVATLLSQTLVSASDPALKDPSKFVGSVYTEQEAAGLAASRGWTVRPDGPSWRRVVPSPHPQRVIETPLVQILLDAGAIVVCAGGGGVPVVRDASSGHLRGIEAVVDKDLTAAVLAQALDVDALLLLTDVSAVYRGFGTACKVAIRRATRAELRAEDFRAGSMGPKVEAVCGFVEATGRTAAIGAIEDAARILAGDAGTTITANQISPASRLAESSGTGAR